MIMSKVRNVLRYLTSKYPYGNDLSKTRITKMVYLADWYYAQKYNRQITNIKWYFDHYGPYVPDVYETAVDDKYLCIKNDYSYYGTPKSVIVINDEYEDIRIKLSKKEIEVLDKVIEETKELTWNGFIDMVYNTYPIKESKRYTYLNLVKLAEINRTANNN